MGRFGVSVVSLLLVCSLARAGEEAESGAPTFWPEPLGKLAQPVDPLAAGDARTDASRGGRAGLDPAARAELSASAARHLEAISVAQARGGERSPELIGELTSLAAAYRALGRYDEAIAALEDAVRIARINFGLHSLDQVDAVRALAATRQANADHRGAAEQRRYLRELVDRNRDDPRAVGVLTGLAESEMDAARETLDVPAPVQIGLNTSVSPGSVPLPPRKPALEALYAARADYAAAIAVTRMRAASVEDLLALDDALVDTVYFEYAHPELHGPRSLYSLMNGTPPVSRPVAETGAQILASRVRVRTELGRSPTDIANALLALADWYLVFAQFDSAFTAYEVAHDLLVERGVPTETIAALLHPEMPPRIPLLPERAARSRADGAFRGFIDAAVEITRFGVVKHAEILGTSHELPKSLEKSFRRYLAASRFRPRFVNGELPRTDRFDARFYFD